MVVHVSRNLLEPDPTYLPDDHPDMAARRESGHPASDVARRHPASSYAWAVLAEEALADGDAVAAYAFARTGYHRGLDALRRTGWRGAGPIPASHVPNQGFLRALLALSEAAEAIGETEEHERCIEFLHASGTSPEEVRALR